MTDKDLLNNLLSASRGDRSEWETFLRRFSNLILKVIWQSEKDYDEVMEKYLYICTRLAENDFARLRRFRTFDEQSPRFTTWLAAIVHNLCIDAYRSRHGRKQLPRAILRLPEFDRAIFRKYYWKGYSLDELSQEAGLAGVKPNTLSDAIRRIQDSLEGNHPQPGHPKEIALDETSPQFGVTDPNPDDEEMLVWLNRWLESLGSQDRLIIRLRFWEDMAASEIAETMRISPVERVYPILQRAVERLRLLATETYANRKPLDASVSNKVKGQGERAS